MLCWIFNSLIARGLQCEQKFYSFLNKRFKKSTFEHRTLAPNRGVENALTTESKPVFNHILSSFDSWISHTCNNRRRVRYCTLRWSDVWRIASFEPIVKTFPVHRYGVNVLGSNSSKTINIELNAWSNCWQFSILLVCLTYYWVLSV